MCSTNGASLEEGYVFDQPMGDGGVFMQVFENILPCGGDYTCMSNVNICLCVCVCVYVCNSQHLKWIKKVTQSCP